MSRRSAVGFIPLRWFQPSVVATRWLLIASPVVLLQFLTSSGQIDDLVLPPPTEIAAEVWRTIQTEQFLQDLVRTATEVAVASIIGIIAGLAIGMVFWRITVLGNALALYVATLYAVPMVVFYPILLALLGLGAAPIIVLAAIMVSVPIILSTMTGLREVSPSLVKLGRSLNCSRLDMYRKILLPAAVPLLAPGLQLGVTYGVIGSVVMEFILANQGLGYRISDAYTDFAITEMWAGIVIVMLFCVALVTGLNWVTYRVRRDMG
jgi:NitT/TauT family transport system permease protein